MININTDEKQNAKEILKSVKKSNKKVVKLPPGLSYDFEKLKESQKNRKKKW